MKKGQRGDEGQGIPACILKSRNWIKELEEEITSFTVSFASCNCMLKMFENSATLTLITVKHPEYLNIS